VTVLTFPGCAQPPPVIEDEEVVMVRLRDHLRDEAARMPLDSRWRAWALRRAADLDVALGLRGVR
jgi:hypothetical protein